jgi:hypothetical protein
VSSPAVPWQWCLTVEILQLHALRSYLHRFPYRTHYQLTFSLTYNISHEPHRKHTVSNSNSIVACIFVAVGMCLMSFCPETVIVCRVTA